jgi:hypothetical protein
MAFVGLLTAVQSITEMTNIGPILALGVNDIIQKLSNLALLLGSMV